MSDELTRLLTILNNGSDQAVLDNASDIAALIRQLQRENERAARLLAAVEGLQTAYGNSFSVCQRTDGMWEANTLTDAMIADTATDALIALGEALNG